MKCVKRAALDEEIERYNKSILINGATSQRTEGLSQGHKVILRGKDGSFPEFEGKEEMIEIQRNIAVGTLKAEGV